MELEEKIKKILDRWCDKATDTERTVALVAIMMEIESNDISDEIEDRPKQNKYTTDKKRMDTIEEKIAFREPIKEWAAIYWMAVAIGHLLEWVVKHETGKQ